MKTDLNQNESSAKEPVIKRNKILILIGAAAVCVFVVFFAALYAIPAYHYGKAEDALKSKDYGQAAMQFFAAGNYKDASVRFHYEEAEDALNSRNYAKAAAEFKAAGSFMDSKTRAANAQRNLDILTTGSCEFGTWNGKPITWQVLNIKGDKALLISENILTVHQYDGLEKELGGKSLSIANVGSMMGTFNITWADSDLRVWLNADFLNAAFSKNEQKAILLSKIINPGNTTNGTMIDGGVDSEDKLFVLSVDEAKQYFSNDKERVADFVMTEDDMNNILKPEKDFGYSQEYLQKEEDQYRSNYLNQKQAWSWWLRTPSVWAQDPPLISGIVSAKGIVYPGMNGDGTGIGYPVFDYGGVRPTLWVDLNS